MSKLIARLQARFTGHENCKNIISISLQTFADEGTKRMLLDENKHLRGRSCLTFNCPDHLIVCYHVTSMEFQSHPNNVAKNAFNRQPLRHKNNTEYKVEQNSDMIQFFFSVFCDD